MTLLHNRLRITRISTNIKMRIFFLRIVLAHGIKSEDVHMDVSVYMYAYIYIYFINILCAAEALRAGCEAVRTRVLMTFNAMMHLSGRKGHVLVYCYAGLQLHLLIGRAVRQR